MGIGEDGSVRLKLYVRESDVSRVFFVLFCYVLLCYVLLYSVLFCFVLFCFVLFCFSYLNNVNILLTLLVGQAASLSLYRAPTYSSPPLPRS